MCEALLRLTAVIEKLIALIQFLNTPFTQNFLPTYNRKQKKKAQLMSNLRATKSTNSTEKPTNTSIQDEPSEGVQEPLK